MNYSLSIRLCVGGFSFAVHSTGSGQLLFAENVSLTGGETLAACLERGLSLSRIKDRNYERVVLYSTLPSTRLPLDEFRREDMLPLYRLTYAGTSVRYEDMHCQMLPSLEVVEIFPLQSQIEQVLRQYYPNAQIEGLYGSLLNRIAQKQQGSIQPLTFSVIIEGESLMVVLLKNGRLSYANVFHTDKEANRLYYILMVWKTLNLDQRHDVCYLYQSDEDFRKVLGKYILNVQPDTCVL